VAQGVVLSIILGRTQSSRPFVNAGPHLARCRDPAEPGVTGSETGDSAVVARSPARGRPLATRDYRVTPPLQGPRKTPLCTVVPTSLTAFASVAYGAPQALRGDYRVQLPGVTEGDWVWALDGLNARLPRLAGAVESSETHRDGYGDGLRPKGPAPRKPRPKAWEKPGVATFKPQRGGARPRNENGRWRQNRGPTRCFSNSVWRGIPKRSSGEAHTQKE